MGRIAVGVAALGVVLAFLLVALLGALLGAQAENNIGQAGAICAPAGPPGAAPGGLSPDQMKNAGAIIAAGASLKVPPKANVVAIATAMQESTLKNLPGGDRDSAGLFQQRPSQGWGSLQQVTDPTASAKTFFEHLLAIPGWESMPVTQAAQAVQGSAFPSAYAKWEQVANAVVGAVGGITCGAPGAPGGANTNTQAVVQAALSQVGVPYAWGGGNAQGPSRGISDGGGAADAHGDSSKVGFDCSGLAQFAWAKAGISVPHQTQSIWGAFQPVIRDRTALQPGDLILLSDNGTPAGIHHVGIYLGNDSVVEAPQSGLTVRVVPNIWDGPDKRWSTQFMGAVRPGGAAPAPAPPAAKA